jgi:O-antigen/teichoic acid export membrane protein
MRHQPLATQRRLFSNTVLLSAGQALFQLMNFVLVICLARVYGLEVLGTYSYAMAIGGLLCILVSLGTNQMLLHRLSTEPGQTVSSTGALLGFQCSIALTLVLLTHLTARWLSSSDTMVWIVTLIVAYHVLTRATSLLVVGFTARQEAAPATLLPAARLVIALLLAGPAMIWGASAPVVLAAMPIAALLMLIVMRRYAMRRFGRPQLRFRPAEISGYLRQGMPYFYVVALNTLDVRLGVILLTVLAGEAATGVYAAAERLIAAAGTIQVMFSMALLPMFTQLWALDRDRFAELSQRAGRLTLFVTLPMATMLALFADDIVRLLYADEFDEASVVLATIAWVLLVRAIAQLLATTSTATARQPLLVRSKLAGLLVLTAASFALIPAYGALGLVAATLAGETSAVLLNYLMLRKAGIPLTICSGSLRVALACLLAACLAWLLSDLAFWLRLLVVAASGMAALWAFGAIRHHDLSYLRAIVKASDSPARP